MQSNNDTSIKTLFFITALIMIISFINILFSIFAAKFLKDQASPDSIDKSIKLNYAAMAFGGIIVIISGILMYQLNYCLQHIPITPDFPYQRQKQQQQPPEEDVFQNRFVNSSGK